MHFVLIFIFFDCPHLTSLRLTLSFLPSTSLLFTSLPYTSLYLPWLHFTPLPSPPLYSLNLNSLHLTSFHFPLLRWYKVDMGLAASNIILTGGNVNFPNFEERFLSEIRPLVPDVFPINVRWMCRCCVSRIWCNLI